MNTTCVVPDMRGTVESQHPSLQQPAGGLDGELVAEPAAEALHVGVLPGRARLDVAAPGLVEPALVAQGVGGQLLAVVTADEPGCCAALGDQAVQHVHGGVGVDPTVDLNRQGLAGVLIHDVEQLQAPPI
jgi:hypothetical protein